MQLHVLLTLMTLMVRDNRVFIFRTSLYLNALRRYSQLVHACCTGVARYPQLFSGKEIVWQVISHWLAGSRTGYPPICDRPPQDFCIR